MTCGVCNGSGDIRLAAGEVPHQGLRFMGAPFAIDVTDGQHPEAIWECPDCHPVADPPKVPRVAH